MDKMERIGVTALLSALFSWLGVIAVPFLLLVALQIIDYATGLCAAKYRNEHISSYKSFNGIAKKICMWLLVVVGGIVDWLIVYSSTYIGISLPLNGIVAIAVCVWLMCNEIISVLENMIDIGVRLPKFMLRITKHIQSKVEDVADITADEDEGGEVDV